MSIDQEQLREGLRAMAEYAPDVDLRPGVRRTVRRYRRRRIAAVGAMAVVALVLGAGVVAGQRSRAVPAAPYKGAGTPVDLATLPGGTVSQARLVVAVAGGETYAVGSDGRGVRLPIAPGAGPTGDWQLTPDGRSLSGLLGAGTDHPVAVIAGVGGHRTEVALPGDRSIQWAALSPDQSRLAVVGGSTFGQPGSLRLVDVPSGRVASASAVTPDGGEMQAAWSLDASTLGFVRSAEPIRVIDTGSVRFERPGSAVIPEASFGGVGIDASVDQGWLVSPEGHWLLLGVRAIAGSSEEWYQVDAGSGVLWSTLTRPTGETPLAWTSDGHLVWWRLMPGGTHAQVIRSDVNGTHDHVLYDVTLPADRVVYAWYASAS